MTSTDTDGYKVGGMPISVDSSWFENLKLLVLLTNCDLKR